MIVYVYVRLLVLRIFGGLQWLKKIKRSSFNQWVDTNNWTFCTCIRCGFSSFSKLSC